MQAVEKPKLTYAQWQSSQFTVARIIQRVIDETKANPEMKQLGHSHLCSLEAMQRMSIGAKNALTLTMQDIIEHAKERRRKVKAATVNAGLVQLGGVLDYAGSSWADCAGISREPIRLAKPFLKKHGIIGKSIPRKRVATDAEIDMLLNLFAQQQGRKQTRINMVDFTLAGLSSTRRRGELCRMQHGDIDWDRKDKEGNPTPMYMIRDVKHPTEKKGNHVWFPLFPEFAEIILRQPRKDQSDPTEKVFPYKPESVSQRYIDAKKRCGIVDLRLHDNRRRSITRWLAVFKSPHKVKLISGHKTTLILERVYDATDPAVLHAEFAALPKVPASVQSAA